MTDFISKNKYLLSWITCLTFVLRVYDFRVFMKYFTYDFGPSLGIFVSFPSF